MMIEMVTKETRAAWRRISALVVLAAKNGVCKSSGGYVDAAYIEKNLINMDVILYKRREGGGLGGFLLGQYQGGRVYIAVVCSNEPGAGKALIQEALTLGRAKGFQRAGLHALPHVTEYYPRFGFRFPEGERVGDNVDGYYMEKNLSNTVNWRPKALRSSPRRPKRLATPPQISERRQRQRLN